MNQNIKNSILKYLADEQVRFEGMYPRFEEYKGFCINDDDCPVFTYKNLSELGDIKEIKPIMIELRNGGLVELLVAVNEDCKPSGSGWSLTQKGLIYVVDNNLIEKEDYE